MPLILGNNNVFINTIFLTSIEIVLIYTLVRFIYYKHDKIEVKKMNKILDRNRKNLKKNSSPRSNWKATNFLIKILSDTTCLY